MRYYDSKRRCLLYIQKKAERKFWDQHWNDLKRNVVYPEKIPLFNKMLVVTKNTYRQALMGLREVVAWRKIAVFYTLLVTG